jgi:arylsulfatase A-like enzyme
MKTNHMKLIAGGVISGCIVPFGVSAAAPQSRPNVIVILADDQGWGDLAFNGNRSTLTPNIDRIAQQGASFENFYVCPVSSPTRAEFLTGRYSARGGVWNVSRGGERLDLDEVTIADYFKQAGYSTGAFGKWHNGTQYPYHPNARGFDEFYGFCSGHWGNYWQPTLERNGEIVTGMGFITDDLTSNAIEFIKAHREEPFFVYVPYNTPHSPMQVPDKWWDKVKKREVEQRTTTSEVENLDFTKAAMALNENLDWNVGRILSTVEELGLDDNTIILYFSDNGPNSNRWNGGMKGRKGSTDEGGVRSSLFVRWPGRIAEGVKIDQLSGAIDLMPTLLALSGNPVNFANEIDGVNLAPLFGQPGARVNRTLFTYWNRRMSVRAQDYLLDNEGVLYNTRLDRAQKTPVTGKEGDAKTEEMKQSASWFRANVLSQLPENDTRPFVIGHPEESYSKLPARDATESGGLKRSSGAPNNSYYSNWTSTSDSICWSVKVERKGRFEAIVYYTCAPENTGSSILLSAGGGRKLASVLTAANDVPMLGAELDRVPRIESYFKGFAPFSLGEITLDEGDQTLSLKATDIPGEEVMYFWMLVLRRI